VEGKAIAAAATSAAGKMPLTVENVQEAVVKALATHAPAAAALAGMHEFERGNGFGLGEHTAFRAITEGVTADKASPRGVGTGKKSDSGPRREPSRPAQILNWIERISVAGGLLSIIVAIVALWGETMGEIGQEAVATLKNVALTAFTYALARGSMVKAILFIFVVGLQPAAAYSVAGIGSSSSCSSDLLSYALGRARKIGSSRMGSSRELVWGRAQPLAICKVGMG